MYYLPRKLPKSRQVCSQNYRILPTSHGLVDKVGQEGNLGYHFLPTCHGLVIYHCQVMR